MRSKVTAVAYFHSGDIDTAVHVTAVSLTLLCKSQRCHWHRCAVQWCYLYRCASQSGVIDTAVHVTTVSMIPLCKSQWCNWHHCTCLSGVNDTSVLWAAESDFLIKKTVLDYSQRCFWLQSGVNDTTAICTVVSLTPLWHAQRYHWHCCDMHNGVIDTAVTFTAVSLTPLWHA
jgi:hypothetical protein